MRAIFPEEAGLIRSWKQVFFNPVQWAEMSVPSYSSIVGFYTSVSFGHLLLHCVIFNLESHGLANDSCIKRVGQIPVSIPADLAAPSPLL
jgi:hypothetical protein